MEVSETVDDSTNDASRPTLLEELKQKMSDKIFRMLLTLRAKKNVPYTISVQMIACANSWCDYGHTAKAEVAQTFGRGNRVTT